MFVKEFKTKKLHTRKSKCGKEHSYYRHSTVVELRCDNCVELFTRPRSKMDPKRLSNNYFHVCENCDAKKFAQKRGVERRKVWSLTASSDLPIGRI